MSVAVVSLVARLLKKGRGIEGVRCTVCLRIVRVLLLLVVVEVGVEVGTKGSGIPKGNRGTRSITCNMRRHREIKSKICNMRRDWEGVRWAPQ